MAAPMTIHPDTLSAALARGRVARSTAVWAALAGARRLFVRAPLC